MMGAPKNFMPCFVLFSGAAADYERSQALNPSLGVNMSWTLREDASEIDVRVEAHMEAGGWLGTGWNVRGSPFLHTPGYYMEGSDLVLGYILPSGQACVRVVSMGKSPWEFEAQRHWWGPNGPACFEVSKATFEESNGVTSLSFTRPLTTSGGPENCGQNDNSILRNTAQKQLYAGATSSQVPSECEGELAPVNFQAFAHKHNLFHGYTDVDYDASETTVV